MRAGELRKYRDANRGDQAVEIWIADVKARAG